MEKNFDQGYAVLIGVGQCEYAPWSLPVTVQDARAVQAALGEAALGAYPPRPDSPAA